MECPVYSRIQIARSLQAPTPNFLHTVGSTGSLLKQPHQHGHHVKHSLLTTQLRMKKINLMLYRRPKRDLAAGEECICHSVRLRRQRLQFARLVVRRDHPTHDGFIDIVVVVQHLAKFVGVFRKVLLQEQLGGCAHQLRLGG